MVMYHLGIMNCPFIAIILTGILASVWVPSIGLVEGFNLLLEIIDHIKENY